MGKTVLHALTCPFEMVYHFVPWSLLLLVLARIGFNALVLPDRYHDDWGTYCKLSTIEAAQLVPAGAELKIYGKSVPLTMNSVHFTQTRGAILRAYEDSFAPGDYLLIDPELYPYVEVDSVAVFGIRHGKRHLLLGRYVGGRQSPRQL